MTPREGIGWAIIILATSLLVVLIILAGGWATNSTLAPGECETAYDPHTENPVILCNTYYPVPPS